MKNRTLLSTDWNLDDDDENLVEEFEEGKWLDARTHTETRGIAKKLFRQMAVFQGESNLAYTTN